VDAWSTMQMAEALEEETDGNDPADELKGLMAVRCGIMAKRFRQLDNLPYSRRL